MVAFFVCDGRENHEAIFGVRNLPQFQESENSKREIKQKAGPFGTAALQGSGDRGREERGPPQR